MSGSTPRPDRRRVLELAAAGAACLALGRRGVARHPGQGDAEPEHDCALTRALAASRRAGKPLLVLQLDDGRLGFSPPERMELITWYLEDADAAALADLALVEVACATRAQAREHLLVRPQDAEAWMLLVEAQRGENAARAVELELPPIPEPGRSPSLTGEEGEFERRQRACVAAIAKGVRGALLPEEHSLHHRMGELEASLDAEDRAALAQGLRDPERLAPAVADRAAALVLWTAASHPFGDALRARVAQGAALRLRERAPHGGVWHAIDWCPPCGMAYSTRYSRAFLDLYGRGTSEAPRCGAGG